MRSVRLPVVGVAVLLLIAIGWTTISTPRQSEERRSDHFWRLLAVSGMEAERYSSLDEMATASDLVVLGHIKSIDLGRRFELPVPKGVEPADNVFQFAAVTIQVDSTLSQRAGSPNRYVLEFMIPPNTSVDQLRASVPTEQTLFFLRSKGLDMVRRGKAKAVASEEMPFVRLVSTQGLLRNLDGLAHPNPDAEDDFLVNLAHTPFADALATVKTATR